MRKLQQKTIAPPPQTKDEFVRWMVAHNNGEETVRTFPTSVIVRLNLNTPSERGEPGFICFQQPIGNEENDRDPAHFFHPVFAARHRQWITPGRDWGAAMPISDLGSDAATHIQQILDDAGCPQDVRDSVQSVQLMVEGSFSLNRSMAPHSLELTSSEMWDLAMVNGCLAEYGIFGAYRALEFLLDGVEDKRAYLQPPHAGRPQPGPAPPCPVCGEGGSERRCDVCGASGHEDCLDEEYRCCLCHAPTYAFDWAAGDYDMGVIGVENVLEEVLPSMVQEFAEREGRQPTDDDIEKLKVKLRSVIAERFSGNA